MPRFQTMAIAAVLVAALGAASQAPAALLATVGSEKIDDIEFNAKAAAEERNLGRALSAEEKQAMLQALVNQRLLVAKARADGLHKKDEVKRAVQDTERQILSNLVYEAEVGSKVQVSDTEVKAFFEQNPQLFELRRVSQILIQPLSPDKATAAENEAKRIKARVSASPKSFADTARSESDDPASREKGGDLGELRRGMLLKELEDAVFSAKSGSIVGPVRTQFGFHILHVKSTKKQGFDEAKELIAREIARARAGELQQKLLEELNKKYKVKLSAAK
jgi:parvulin-like peptidyl-prolyl isomerase